MALVAQMVKAFGMNPKVRCSSFLPQVETFYASKTLVISQKNIRFVSKTNAVLAPS